MSKDELNLLIRMSTGLNILSLVAQDTFLVRTVQEDIRNRIGIPVLEQELFYKGEKLSLESTLNDYGIVENDAELTLVDLRQVRHIMQNPDHEIAWEELYDFVFLIDTIYNEEEENKDLADLVKEKFLEYLEKTPTQVEKAEKYIMIFISSAALDELINLCRSRIVYHESCAQDLVSVLLNWITELPPPLNCLTVPILLKLCLVLSKSSHEYYLYIACRSSLGNLMVHLKLSSTREIATHVTFQDLKHILRKIFTDIGHDLTDKISDFCPLLTDVTDLKKFLLPVKKLTVEFLASYRKKDIAYFQDLLSGLIRNMGFSLRNMEELQAHSVPVGCYEHIVILHELSAFSQLFQSLGTQLWTMLLHRKLLFCYLIINYGRRNDNYEWIYEHKEVTNFECRRHLAMFLFPEVENNSVELPVKIFKRSKLWEQSLKYVTESETNTLQAGLLLKFKDEEATGPGVTREWFYLVCKDLFSSQRGLFQYCPKDRRRIFPKSGSIVNFRYFEFAGRLVALAFMHKIQIGVMLDPVLCLQLPGRSICLEDIRDMDPILYNSCIDVLNMDPTIVDQDALMLTFSVDVIDESGSTRVVELVQGGVNMSVDSKNGRRYVDLVIQHRFVKSVAIQVNQFTGGFNDIIGSSQKRKLFFQILESKDVDGMLHGSGKTISVEDWRAHTKYNGYHDSDDQIGWFWQIVEKMSAEQREILLFFWTSVRYPPIEAFTALSPLLSIHKTQKTLYHLPTSHTCQHLLCLPPYPSSEVMEDRLNTISQEHICCSLVFYNINSFGYTCKHWYSTCTL